MTVLAVALGALSAVLFSFSGVLQHRAVGRTPTLAGLLRRPLWLAGAGMAGAGSLVHAVALGLAPISVVQPVGVLAVPLGVLVERWFATRDRRRGLPDRGGLGRWAVAGLVAAVLGVGVVVGVTTGSATAGPVDPGRLLLTCVVLGGIALLPAALSNRARGTVRCLARAVPAAIAFGLVSGLLRAGIASVAAGAGPALVAAIAAGLLVLLAAGAAGVQLAYRSGPPSLVLACLTVVDPIVAVGFGVTALGERIGTAPSDVALAGAGALLAAAGVALLARHHPDARSRPSCPEPARSTPELSLPVRRVP